MHPYSKDTHSQPVVNVNLSKCNHAAAMHPDHAPYCDAQPVLVPLSLQPFRSVTFTVRLGECGLPCHQHLAVGGAYGITKPSGIHDPHCPARPIRVTCSISGKTLDDSFVSDVDWRTRNELGDWNPSPMSPKERTTALRACGERWGLVKALVLGKPCEDVPTEAYRVGTVGLCDQRDAVYAAIADMARAEEAHNAAIRALVISSPGPLAATFSRLDPAMPAAGRFLAAYVEHLVEQVGAL